MSLPNLSGLSIQQSHQPATVALDITHNLLQARMQEIALPLASTIDQVKQKVYRLTGSKPEFVRLFLNGQPLTDDNATLGAYAPTAGMILHVVDDDPYSNLKGMDDVSKVEKYVISEDAYAKRADNARNFKQRMMAEKKKQDDAKAAANGETVVSSSSLETKEAPKKETEDNKSIEARIKVGQRCQVRPGDRRGVVAYLGPVPEIPAPPGYSSSEPFLWVGVNYDAPEGKNDGTVKSKRYFTCKPKHGGFLNPAFVQTGDFPERDLDDSDEDSDDDKAKKPAAAPQEDINEEL